MIDSATYRMADRLAGENLAGILREKRSERKSLGRIASDLFAEFGIEATPMTVKNWCDTLDIPKPPPLAKVRSEAK